jgi:hypothetical protein
MKSETEKKLKKIKRISNILRAICKVLFALAICVFLVAMFAILAGWGNLAFSGDSVPLAPLAPLSRLILGVIFALGMAINFKGLYHLHRLFGNYGRGDIFTTDSVAQIRHLGITALLWAGVTFLWTLAGALALAHPNVHFDGNCLVIGPVIIVISWFMEMAAEIREENELTV